MENVVLHVDDVDKRFGGLRALADVDLSIIEGKTHAIIGPNGAGKSTLLNVVVGLIKPDRGAVVFDGDVITGMKPHEITQLGMSRVFQTPEIFPDLSLLDNVILPILAKRDGSFNFSPFKALRRKKKVLAQAEHMLEDVGLVDDKLRNAETLSRGDKRRLELAMCLSQEPKLLLLDEPTAGMARLDTNNTIALLQKIKDRGMTIVIIEHDMHVVFSLADQISVLAQGKIIAEGKPEDIKNNPKVKEAYLGEEAVDE
ncbi:MAG: ABC transporter ATP-binding protein [Arenicellales bacterium]